VQVAQHALDAARQDLGALRRGVTARAQRPEHICFLRLGNLLLEVAHEAAAQRVDGHAFGLSSASFHVL
jgi:hypothetical protein